MQMNPQTKDGNHESNGQPVASSREHHVASTAGDTLKLRKPNWVTPTLLLVALGLLGGALVAWKVGAIQRNNAAATNQPEPMETVTVAVATKQQHRRTTTSIGTVVALRSVTLRNELAGTVREAKLTPGQIVEEGTLLVALDVSVEEAELKALEAEAALAKTLLSRMERAVQSRATSQMEVDRARAQLDVAEAQTARFKAVIARKTIRAPFRARIGISDVHPGQYLNEGTLLTTLQGVDEAAHVDFAIPQAVAAQLQPGETVEILAGTEQPVVTAEIVALDARVNPVTRSTTVRARVNDADKVPAPGASVRVRVPASAPVVAVSVPVSALRKGPSGDHVFIIKPDDQGKLRAQLRPAQAGPVLGDQVLLLSGVGAGDQVAAHGSFKLRDKVLVAVTQTNSLAAN
jgi:membrane fusion protein (multidrug efflux system)